MNQVDDQDIASMLVMRALNYEIGYIANQIGVSRNTVARHLNSLRESAEGNHLTDLVLEKIMKGRIDSMSVDQKLSTLAGLEAAVDDPE